jgi:hypothetical protein
MNVEELKDKLDRILALLEDLTTGRHAAALGRKTSARKAAAARENGKRGGRPKGS